MALLQRLSSNPTSKALSYLATVCMTTSPFISFPMWPYKIYSFSSKLDLVMVFYWENYWMSKHIDCRLTEMWWDKHRTCTEHFKKFSLFTFVMFSACVVFVPTIFLKSKLPYSQSHKREGTMVSHILHSPAQQWKKALLLFTVQPCDHFIPVPANPTCVFLQITCVLITLCELVSQACWPLECLRISSPDPPL